jgi:hypothetical protein
VPRDDENPSASRSSVGLARLDGSTRLLRLQADERLKTMLEVDVTSSGGAGLLTIPSREAVDVGAEIRVEISFGPMADEITLRGLVEQTTPRGSRAPLIAHSDRSRLAARIRYIHEVLSEKVGKRPRAKSRHVAAVSGDLVLGSRHAHQRPAERHQQRWRVRSRCAPVDRQCNHPRAQHGRRWLCPEPLKLDAVVAWAGRSQGRRGFGVRISHGRSRAGRPHRGAGAGMSAWRGLID